MSSMSAACALCFALCLLRACSAFDIISQQQTTQIINGGGGQHLRILNTATVRCSSGDTVEQLLVNNGSGSTPVAFICERPYFVFQQSRVGFVPRVQIPVSVKMCLVDHSSGSNVTASSLLEQAALRPSRRLLEARFDAAAHGRFKTKDSGDSAAVVTIAGSIAAGAALGGPEGALAGGVVAGGVLLTCHFTSFCSNGGEIDALKAAMSQMENQFTNISHVLDTMNDWEHKTDAFIQDTQATLQEDQQSLLQLQAASAANTDGLQRLNARVDQLQAVTDQIGQVVSTGMTSLTDQLVAQANESQHIWAASVLLHQEEQSKITQLASMITTVTRQLRELDTSVLELYKDTDMRRGLIALFHAIETLDTHQPTRAFLSEVGTPPLDKASLLAMRSLGGAFRMGSVSVQTSRDATPGVAGAYVAEQLLVSLVCDPVFLLDHVLQHLTMQSIFDYLGPAGCVPKDAGHNWDVSGNWSCDCVITVTYDSCPTSSAFPWNSTVPTPRSLQESQLCTGPVQSTDLDHDSPSVLVATSLAEVQTILGDKCGAVRDATCTHCGSARMRMFTLMSYRDLTLQHATLDMCNMNFAQQPAYQSVNSDLFSFGLYTLWGHSYLLASQYRLPALEQLIYGKIARGLSYTTEPFNSDANSTQTYRCDTMSYIRASAEKLSMFELRQIGVQKTLGVSVGGVLVQDSASMPPAEASVDGPSVVTTQLPSSQTGASVRVTTNLMMANSAQAALPGRFYRVGKWLEHGAGATRYTWDVPFAQLSGSSRPTGRAGAVDYLFQPYNGSQVPASLSFDEWTRTYGEPLNALFVGNDPTMFKRTAITEGEGYRCDKSIEVNSDGTLEVPPRELEDWCTILEHFLVEFVGDDDADAGTVRFYPREYTYEATVEVPGGAFVQTLTTVCPDAAVVSSSAGGYVHVRLNTSAVEPVTVHLRAFSGTGNASCTRLDEDRQFSITSPVDLDVLSTGECAPMFLQVTTLDTGAACYSGNGVGLATAHAVVSGPGVTGPVQSAIGFAEDKAVDDIVNQMLSLTDFIQKVSNLRFSSESDQDVIDAVNRYTEERLKATQNMSLWNQRNDEALQKSLQRVNDSSAGVADDINRARAAEAAAAASNARAAVYVALAAFQAELVHNATLAVDAALAEEHAALNLTLQLMQDFLNSNSNSGGCSLPSFLSFLCGVFSFLGEVFKDFIVLLVILFLIWACVKLLPPCIKLVAKAMKSHGAEDVSVTGQTGVVVVQHDAFAKPDKLDTTTTDKVGAHVELRPLLPMSSAALQQTAEALVPADAPNLIRHLHTRINTERQPAGAQGSWYSLGGDTSTTREEEDNTSRNSVTTRNDEAL